MCTGALPENLAVMPSLVVADLSNNQLTGSLENYAITTQVARDDLNSPLRYLSLAGNTFTGACG